MPTPIEINSRFLDIAGIGLNLTSLWQQCQQKYWFACFLIFEAKHSLGFFNLGFLQVGVQMYDKHRTEVIWDSGKVKNYASEAIISQELLISENGLSCSSKVMSL